jgi:hypothetical protein
MSTPQNFKGDDFELQMQAAGTPAMDTVELQLDEFFDGAFTAMPLGDVLYDSNRSPLANAIDRDIFRASFPELFDSFVVAGSFDSYISVFHKIFGETADITFTVPAPGKLEIDILADEIILSNFVARQIVDNAYTYDNMLTQAGDQIVFQSVKGFKTQYELEQMLYEMVPAGIYTIITLNIA